MPDQPNPKLRAAPSLSDIQVPADDPSLPAYADLDVVTNFSFGRGASHADELVKRAAELGHKAIGITDVNTLAGLVRVFAKARDLRNGTGYDLKLVVGWRLVLTDAPDVLVWVVDRSGYAHLCQLLTLGKRRATKGAYDLSLADLLDRAGVLLAAVDPLSPTHGDPILRPLRDTFGDRLSLVARCTFGRDDATHLTRLATLTRRHGRQRPRPRLRRAVLQPDQRVRRVRLPREPRRQLRPARLNNRARSSATPRGLPA